MSGACRFQGGTLVYFAVSMLERGVFLIISDIYFWSGVWFFIVLELFELWNMLLKVGFVGLEANLIMYEAVSCLRLIFSGGSFVSQSRINRFKCEFIYN